MKHRGGQSTLVVQQASLNHHSGPLPSPEAFEAYDRALPGAAERILAMAEGEQRHRHFQEGRLITATIVSTYAGQAIAGLLGGTVCVGGVLAILKGQELGGAAAVIAALASMVITFLRGQRKEAAEPTPTP